MRWSGVIQELVGPKTLWDERAWRRRKAIPWEMSPDPVPLRRVNVGLLGLARRDGTFSELGLRSWEESGCKVVEETLMAGSANLYFMHRPLVVRSGYAAIEHVLRDWCDVPSAEMRCDLILTVGGTGYSKDDFLPEITQRLLTREAPGLAELVRRAVCEGGYAADAATRGVAGMRGSTLLINLPGPVAGLAQEEPLRLAMKALLAVLPGILLALQQP